MNGNGSNHLKEKQGDTSTQNGETKAGGKFAATLSDWLTHIYHPFLPLLKKIHIRREKIQPPNPEDEVLLPESYVAEGELASKPARAPVHTVHRLVLLLGAALSLGFVAYWLLQRLSRR